MTDKELLVLAAKAAGIKRIEFRDEVPYVSMGYLPLDDWEAWNPLVDDGDTMRLAVKMDLCITQWRHYSNAQPHVMVGYRTGPNHGANWIEDYNGDEMAANRRAVVCAVAEIGKAMP